MVHQKAGTGKTIAKIPAKKNDKRKKQLSLVVFGIIDNICSNLYSNFIFDVF